MAMTIEQEYTATRQKSLQLYTRAKEVIPSGVEHDGRYMKPFPFYVAWADKARKWDVDGNELIDLWSGHGALILGHNPPAVTAAIREQLEKGCHYSSCHPLQVEEAELLTQMIPCAEKVRWQQSGLEANALAIRMARGYTGKNKAIKFRGHFHGYFDEGYLGVRPPFDVPMSIGIPKESLSNILLADHNSSTDVARLIEETNNDVACVIIDPICHACALPNRPGFLEEVREITRQKGVVLIWDEVVSGFRLAPGGAQERFGVTPDLAVVAKPVGGGLPSSAVVGRKDIMDVLTFTDDREHDRFHRVMVQGTHAATPIVVAAGLACLKELRSGEVQAYIDKLGAMLRKGMTEVLQKHGVPGRCYGDWSVGRIFIGENHKLIDKCAGPGYTAAEHEIVDAGNEPRVARNLRMGMCLNGVDIMGGFGLWLLNAALTEQDIDQVVDAFDRTIERMQEEGIL